MHLIFLTSQSSHLWAPSPLTTPPFPSLTPSFKKKKDKKKVGELIYLLEHGQIPSGQLPTGRMNLSLLALPLLPEAINWEKPCGGRRGTGWLSLAHRHINWLQAATQVTDICMGFDANTGDRHQHKRWPYQDHWLIYGSQELPGPWASIWPQAIHMPLTSACPDLLPQGAKPKDINKWSVNNTDCIGPHSSQASSCPGAAVWTVWGSKHSLLQCHWKVWWSFEEVQGKKWVFPYLGLCCFLESEGQKSYQLTCSGVTGGCELPDVVAGNCALTNSTSSPAP